MYDSAIKSRLFSRFDSEKKCVHIDSTVLATETGSYSRNEIEKHSKWRVVLKRILFVALPVHSRCCAPKVKYDGSCLSYSLFALKNWIYLRCCDMNENPDKQYEITKKYFGFPVIGTYFRRICWIFSLYRLLLLSPTLSSNRYVS